MKVMTVALVAGLLMVAGGAALGADKVATRGNLADTFCYTMEGAQGEGDRDRGAACADKGIPIALLDNGTERLYILLSRKNATSVPQTAIAGMGRQATITGSTHLAGGSLFLALDSVR